MRDLRKGAPSNMAEKRISSKWTSCSMLVSGREWPLFWKARVSSVSGLVCHFCLCFWAFFRYWGRCENFLTSLWARSNNSFSDRWVIWIVPHLLMLWLEQRKDVLSFLISHLSLQFLQNPSKQMASHVKRSPLDEDPVATGIWDVGERLLLWNLSQYFARC